MSTDGDKLEQLSKNNWINSYLILTYLYANAISNWKLPPKRLWKCVNYNRSWYKRRNNIVFKCL